LSTDFAVTSSISGCIVKEFFSLTKINLDRVMKSFVVNIILAELNIY